MHVATYIAIGIKTMQTCTRVQLCFTAWAPLKHLFNRNFKAHATAELLVECKCQFIRVKQEQASEKLEKTTIHIVETSVLSLWHRTIFGQGGPLLVTKIGPAEPFLVSQKWSSRTSFSSKNSPARPFLPGPFFLWQVNWSERKNYSYMKAYW